VVGIGIDTVVIVSPPQAPGPVNRIDDSDLLRLVQARPKGQSIREAAAAALVAEDRHIPVATLEAATRRIQRKLRAAACKPVASMSSRRG